MTTTQRLAAMTRALIIALLVIQLPVLVVFGWGASQALSDLDPDPRNVLALCLGYSALAIIGLAIIARFGRWRASWLVAGTIATFWPIVVIGYALST